MNPGFTLPPHAGHMTYQPKRQVQPGLSATPFWPASEGSSPEYPARWT